jgi:drug/metabolite transporter (DMT)-like permease
MSAIQAQAQKQAPGAEPVRLPIDGFAVAVMLLLTFSWGLNQVAIKVSNVGYNPMLAVLVRSVGGGLLVYLWCLWRGIALFSRDGTLWPGVAAGLLFGSEFVLIFIGLEYTSAARSALMVNTMPFWTLAGAHFLLGEKVTRQKLVGLVLAFVGVILIFSDGLSLPGPDAIWGDLLCLLAGALWAATVLLIRVTRLSRASAEKTLLYQLAGSAVVALPLIPLYGPLLRDVTALATASLAFQTVFIVAFTYVLWFWMVRRYPASGLTSFTFLSPAFGVILAGLLLGEPLTVRVLGALALIAAGLALVNRPARRTTPV